MDNPTPHTAPQQAGLNVAAQRLHRRFDALTGPSAVEAALTEARAHFDGSAVRTFIPILAERRAAGSLVRIGAHKSGEARPASA
ncbi:three-helix bundle dimerization domain-containing protein [Kitasatospora sp. NPDC096147]|uniref:three-helix bundle dimerization domain-containing protein n=1 Tax=Kitasatospora sp. NPDC096147 TaxID=3364093 RepID=UPI00382B6D1E